MKIFATKVKAKRRQFARNTNNFTSHDILVKINFIKKLLEFYWDGKKHENRQGVHHPLNSKPVKSGQGDSIADIPFRPPILLLLHSLFSPFFFLPFSLYFSFHERDHGARTNISSQRPHPDSR